MLQFLITLTDESNHGKIEHIYNTYHDYMMKCAVAKFKSFGRRNCTFDAEDAVQNTFMKITKHIEKIDFSRGEKDVKNYCLAILNNEICNIIDDNQENFAHPPQNSNPPHPPLIMKFISCSMHSRWTRMESGRGRSNSPLQPAARLILKASGISSRTLWSAPCTAQASPSV